jgi:hypothetical protein
VHIQAAETLFGARSVGIFKSSIENRENQGIAAT